MSEERRGELYALLLSLLESWFPILTLKAIALIGPIHTYACTIAVAVLFFLPYARRRGSLAQLRNPQARYDLLGTAFFITLMYLLIYLGLRYTTAGNMSLIIFLQLFFAYLYFNVLGGEMMGVGPTLGALLMGAGALLILFPERFGGFNAGDLLILLAAALAPVANLFQQRARRLVPAETVLLFRYLFALPILWLIASCFEPSPEKERLFEALPWIVAAGLLVMVAAKILWIEALHRISITKLSAMTALIPLFTLLFAFWVLHEVPTARQLAGVPLILLGGLLLTRRAQ